MKESENILSEESTTEQQVNSTTPSNQSSETESSQKTLPQSPEDYADSMGGWLSDYAEAKSIDVDMTPQPEKANEGKAPRPWDLHPENYAVDALGQFILRKDGTPKKRPGKPLGSAHNFHSETKAKMAARRKVREARKKIAKAEQKIDQAKHRLKQKVDVVKKLDAASGGNKTSTVMEADAIQHLPESLQNMIRDDNYKVAFRPNSGPQTDFLAAPEKDVLYGGAAGGGKSYAMLVDPLRYIHEKDHRFLILRRTLNELDELIDKSRELYPIAYPGAKFNQQKKTWEFPSGAKGYFGYLEKDSDVYQYIGRAFSWIGFDEITHLPTEFAWNYLRSRLRTTNPNIICYMRCTANPGGVGHAWVKKRYVEPADPNTPFVVDGISRKFIPARLSDNPYLHNDGQYEKVLKSLPEIERQRLLEGNWDIHDGIAFPEFNKSIHTILPFEIPMHWERIKGIDYGYGAPSAVVWGAIDPDDGTLVIYRELYEKGLEPSQLAIKMHQMEQAELRSVPGIIDGQCFARTGHTGPTQAESIMRAGHKIRRADKNRHGGKIQIHEWLRVRENGKPNLIILTNCVNLIREIGVIPLDKKDPEDVDTNVDDHAYDALRYLIMSRPRREGYLARSARYKSEIYLAADQHTGY